MGNLAAVKTPVGVGVSPLTASSEAESDCDTCLSRTKSQRIIVPSAPVLIIVALLDSLKLFLKESKIAKPVTPSV